jgi:poly(A) polymerase Pap1
MIKKMKINEMVTMEQLTEASEFEKFELLDLITRAKEIGTEKEVNEFITLCKSYDKTINCSSWSKSQNMVRS